jgi:UDP-N-acetylglucosamine 2-epimerase (hydrolysing)
VELRKIIFVTGTRADFGKLKPLMARVRDCPAFEHGIFATGMHMLARYGSTVNEIRKGGFDRIFPFINQDASVSSQMDLVLAHTIQGLGHYVREFGPDMIVIHGDRVEALAGAVVGALNNTLVAHVEGGEVSGTIDELIRHAVSKLSHLHFVSNDEARRRLIQMGEVPESVFVIGSPDIDVMLSERLPDIDEVRAYYEIPFERYGVCIYHAVTSELDALERNAAELVRALLDSAESWVVVFPNNDTGCEIVLRAYEPLRGNPRFRLLPSMRFEYYLSMLKRALAIVGNSSSGIHEAPVYGVPTVNVGTRQLNRFEHVSIANVREDAASILGAIRAAPDRFPPTLHFGSGKSAELFLGHLESEALWATPRQKQFRDVRVARPEGGDSAPGGGEERDTDPVPGPDAGGATGAGASRPPVHLAPVGPLQRVPGWRMGLPSPATRGHLCFG